MDSVRAFPGEQGLYYVTPNIVNYHGRTVHMDWVWNLDSRISTPNPINKSK